MTLRSANQNSPLPSSQRADRAPEAVTPPAAFGDPHSKSEAVPLFRSYDRLAARRPDASAAPFYDAWTVRPAEPWRAV